MVYRALTPNRLKFFLQCFVLSAIWASVNLSTTWKTGLLSDDYDFMADSSAPWYAPFDTIHWSPLLRLLFKSMAVGQISPETAHVVITALHGCTCLALAALIRHGLGARTMTAWFAALLWAVTPAASESVFWLCASGYVVIAITLILSILIVLHPNKWTHKHGVGLLALQIVACIAWDWAIVLFPAALLARILLTGKKDWIDQSSIIAWLPAFFIWLIYQIARSFLDVEIGYGLFPFGVIRASKDLYLAPAMLFAVDLPQAARVLLAFGCWIIMFIFARQDRRLASLMAVFSFLQLPSMCFGVLQARYLYVSGPIFYALILSGSEKMLDLYLPRQRSFALMPLFLISWQVWSYNERAESWRDSSRNSRELADNLRKRVHELHTESVFLVNIPDSYGDPNKKWRPFAWRRGLLNFIPQGKLVYTSDFVETERLSITPTILTDDLIGKAAVLRVVNEGDPRRPRFTIVNG